MHIIQNRMKCFFDKAVFYEGALNENRLNEPCGTRFFTKAEVVKARFGDFRTSGQQKPRRPLTEVSGKLELRTTLYTDTPSL